MPFSKYNSSLKLFRPAAMVLCASALTETRIWKWYFPSILISLPLYLGRPSWTAVPPGPEASACPLRPAIRLSLARQLVFERTHFQLHTVSQQLRPQRSIDQNVRAVEIENRLAASTNLARPQIRRVICMHESSSPAQAHR